MKGRKLSGEELSRVDVYYMMTNIKGIMILLIVMFHCVSPVINRTQFSYVDGVSLPMMVTISFVAMIVLSAVPSFVLITGYGSKDVEGCRKSAFGLYFIPYIVLTFFLATEYAFINGVFYVDVFEPLMQLWFLMAMYIWMIILRDVSSIKFAIPLSLVLSLISGMVANGSFFKFTFGVDSFFSLSYVFTFLPFLLIGLKTTQAWLSKIRSTGLASIVVSVIVMSAISIGLGCTFYFDERRRLFDIASLRGNGNYLEYFGGESGFSTYAEVNTYGAFLRILLFAFVFAFIYILVRLIPKRRVPFLTRVGDASMTIFCLHVFILVPISRFIKPDFLIQLAVSIPISVAVCWILSCKKVNKAFMNTVFRVSDAVAVRKKQ